jgi:serine/threonine protein kinase
MDDCPPLKTILNNIKHIPHEKIGVGTNGSVFLMNIENKSYAIKMICIENEKQIESFMQEVQHWKEAQLTIPEIVPVFCESALVDKDTLDSFEYPLYKELDLNTEWRSADKAIAFGFIFTQSVDYLRKIDFTVENTTLLIDNLIKALDILQSRGYIHGDIKDDNILYLKEPYLKVLFIDLEGLCKSPCQKALPQTYLPPNYSSIKKRRFHFRTPSGTKKRTKVTNKSFPKFTFATDRYAVGLTILDYIKKTQWNDPRWRGQNITSEMKELRDTYYNKAYKLISTPIHEYASAIGKEKTTEVAIESLGNHSENNTNRKNRRTRKVNRTRRNV